MHKPELLILDETDQRTGPLMQHEFYDLLNETKKEGRTIFLSSHILPEVEKVCDRVGIIRQGKLITVETIESSNRTPSANWKSILPRLFPKRTLVNIPGCAILLSGIIY